MKKELTAMALLVLLCCGAAFNIRHINSFTGEISACLERSEAAAQAGDFQGALEALDECIGLWDGQHSYTNVFIRHPELDASYESLFEIQELLFQEDGRAAASAYSQMRYRLECIAYMEKPSLGSIF